LCRVLQNQVDSLKTLKEFSAILLLFLFVLPVANGKPLPPISLKMQWQAPQSVTARDVPLTLTLHIFSQISVEQVEIVFTLPEGVVLLDGQIKETIAIEGLKPMEKVYTVLVDKAAVGEIKAEARLNGSGHIAYYAAAMLPLAAADNTRTIANRKLSPRAEEKQKQDYKRVQRDGVWLREYQLP